MIGQTATTTKNTTNLYRATRLNKMSAGKHNRDIPAADRTPGQFIYADTPQEAQAKMESYYPQDKGAFEIEFAYVTPILVFEEVQSRKKAVA